MDIFIVNRCHFSDEFLDSLASGKNSAYYNSLTAYQQRNYNRLMKFIELEGNKAFLRIKSKSAAIRNRRVELIKPSDRDRVLARLYANPETTKNGRDSFYTKVLSFYANIPRRYVQAFLEKQENYQLHLQQTKEKVLRPETHTQINSKWAMDLIDMQNYKSPQNNQRAWLLTVIDIFSKYAYVRAITKKEATRVAAALEDILLDNFSKTGGYPRVIQSDNGLEFKNKSVAEVLSKHEIKHIFSIPYWPQSNGAIERFNKTLKGAIFSQFTRNGNTKFINTLDELVANYNNTIHVTTHNKPAVIHQPNRSNATQVKLAEKHKKDWVAASKIYKPLHRGDFVRLHILTDKEQRKSRTFAKKYVPQWSREIYKVIGIRGSRIDPDKLKTKLTYKLQLAFVRDRNGYIPVTGNHSPVSKSYYRHDLQKVPEP